MLCAECISIFLHHSREASDLTRRRTYVHHKWREDVESAAKNGCRICFAAITKFKSFGNWTSIYVQHPLYGLVQRLHCGEGEDDTIHPRGKLDVHLERLVDLESPPHYLQYAQQVAQDITNGFSSTVREDGFSRRTIPTNTGHNENVALARAWLDRCHESHAICGQTDDSAADIHWQPKRLVDVYAPDGRLKVVERDKQTVSEPYVSMSHCWGKEEFFTLNAKTHDAAVNAQILLEELPRSFRDVIDFCRRLGIPYIWIDSLCILQSGAGSEDDWLDHTKEMRLIYSRCLLNISVNCAASPYEGAFRDRNPTCLSEAYVPSRRHGCEELDVTNYEWYLVTFEEDYSSALRKGPLATRGWVLQERYLSPRILYFAQDRMYWECSGWRTNECCPLNFMENLEPTGVTRTTNDGRDNPSVFSIRSTTFTLSNSRFRNKPSSPEYLWKISLEWFSIVSYYSECHLTYPDKDKAMALEGVAQQLGMLAPKSFYAAGLFSHDLPLGLLWHLPQDKWSNKNGPPAVSNSRAPSWSWLNANSPIQFAIMSMPGQESSQVRTDQYLEDIHVIPQSHALQLRGWLLPTSTIEAVYTSTNSLQSLVYYFDVGRIECKQNGSWWMLPVGKCSNLFGEIQGGLILHKTEVNGQYIRAGMYRYISYARPIDSRVTEELRKHEKVDLMIV